MNPARRAQRMITPGSMLFSERRISSSAVGRASPMRRSLSCEMTMCVSPSVEGPSPLRSGRAASGLGGDLTPQFEEREQPHSGAHGVPCAPECGGLLAAGVGRSLAGHRGIDASVDGRGITLGVGQETAGAGDLRVGDVAHRLGSVDALAHESDSEETNRNTDDVTHG